MRLAIVSTYRPRRCGIAVFSGDLRTALVEADSSLEVQIVSIVRGPQRPRPQEVTATIRQDECTDYVVAASTLNRSGVDVVLIEHEFGIFGGDSGRYVLNLTDGLTVPFVVTLHTVLARPSASQTEVLRALCQRAALVMVFTETARRMVVAQGLVPLDRVRVVPHGVPDLLTAAARAGRNGAGRHGARNGSIRSGNGASSGPAPTGSHKVAAGSVAASHKLPASSVSIQDPALPLGLKSLAGRTVLSTFGLISSSKGLELVIRALPQIVAAHPEVVYLIAGQTHPDVIQAEGESYRLTLERLIWDLELSDHVLFLDRFLSIEELAVLLARTDIYLTPYRSREQIVSGALTYAVAAGCPVVSTPYFYAEDLLSTGAGLLVPFSDSVKLAAAVRTLLDSPAKLAEARAAARRVGAELSWSSVARATRDVLAEVAHEVPAQAVQDVAVRRVPVVRSR
jgi:glycosyltransferase involved in cell wall biosynthesis